MTEKETKHPLIQAVIVAVATGSVVFGVVTYFHQQQVDRLTFKIQELENEKGSDQPETIILNQKIDELRSEKSSLNIRLSEVSESLEQAKSALSSTASKLQSIKVETWHTFSTGEYDRGTRIRPRHYCYHDVNAEARKLCGAYTPYLHRVDVRSGNKCGYVDYVVACLSK